MILKTPYKSRLILTFRTGNITRFSPTFTPRDQECCCRSAPHPKGFTGVLGHSLTFLTFPGLTMFNTVRHRYAQQDQNHRGFIGVSDSF